jgi:hypothetical protein
VRDVDEKEQQQEAQTQQQPQMQLGEEIGKHAKVTCFNCGEWGHFSPDCKAPRLCFICHTSAHVGRDCPDWLKPLEPAQYLESAAQGLGFFHVDV